MLASSNPGLTIPAWKPEPTCCLRAHAIRTQSGPSDSLANQAPVKTIRTSGIWLPEIRGLAGNILGAPAKGRYFMLAGDLEQAGGN